MSLRSLAFLLAAALCYDHCQAFPQQGYSGQQSSPSQQSSSPEQTSTSSSSSSSSSSGWSSGQCPQIWSTIASEFKKDFAGCNDLARSAIRFAFHDAACYSTSLPTYAPASGGADGSLLLSDSEIARSANDPLKTNYRDPYLLPTYQKYQNQNVSAADFVQFAGSVGILSCPGGPTIKTVVGRKDTDTPAPDGLLPEAFGKGSDYQTLIDLWASKTFSPRELAALVGAHTVSRAFAQAPNIPVGSSQDSTPTQWDVKYYSETQSQKLSRRQQGGGGQGYGSAAGSGSGPGGAGVHSFDSDINLSNATTQAGQAFTEFAQNPQQWATEFTAAMEKLSVLGIPSADVNGFVDCTSVLSSS